MYPISRRQVQKRLIAVPHIKYRHLFSEKFANILNNNTNNVKTAIKTFIDSIRTINRKYYEQTFCRF